MDIGTIVTALGAVGAGAILKTLVDNVLGWATGRQGREQSAWDQRDKEAAARRALEEALLETRLTAIEHGVERADLPPWPTYPHSNRRPKEDT